MPPVTWLLGSAVTLLSTELNSLANGSGLLGTADIDVAEDYQLGLFELVVTFGSAPAAGNPIELWFQQKFGANLEDALGGATPRTPGWGPYIFLTNNIAANRMISPPILLPPGLWRPLLINRSGLAFPASGSTLKLTPVTETN